MLAHILNWIANFEVILLQKWLIFKQNSKFDQNMFLNIQMIILFYFISSYFWNICIYKWNCCLFIFARNSWSSIAWNHFWSFRFFSKCVNSKWWRNYSPYTRKLLKKLWNIIFNKVHFLLNIIMNRSEKILLIFNF